MSKYTIEGNINFQEELFKLLDEDSENEDELCQITGLPLQEHHVILECKHHFNYKALYNEIYKQKYEFESYNPLTLPKKDLLKFCKTDFDFFIKCPYCRNIQFTVLPYHKELGLTEIYGINSLDNTLPNTLIMRKPTNTLNVINHTKPVNYVFKMYGTFFKLGKCHRINSFGDKCTHKYVSIIPKTTLYYCKYHYKDCLAKYKMSEKKKIIDARLAVKKEKENKLNERHKLLYDKNAEREAKGLPPLKRLHVLKKNVENIVEQHNISTQQYFPDEEEGCKALLKSGANKGNQCGCKKIGANGLCKRHNPKVKTD